MKKTTAKILKIAAKASEKAAIKSCCKTSGYDAYQPKVPEEVRKLRKS